MGFWNELPSPSPPLPPPPHPYHSYLDTLPTSGNALGRAYRDVEWEGRLLEISRQLGIGAQFGGKYFCHDVRVIRLPRHGASCPVGVGVSCSAGECGGQGGSSFQNLKANQTLRNPQNPEVV